jgi:hypothetical protein
MSLLVLNASPTKLDEKAGTLRINTWKQGLLSRLGHDLLLEVGRFTLMLTQDSPEQKIALQLDAPKDAFRVLAPDALSEKDRREIVDNIRKHLPANLHFVGQIIQQDGQIHIEGKASVGRSEAFLRFPLQLQDRRASAKIRLSHAALGIAPYKAPLGLIQVKDELELSLSFDLSSLLDK